VKLADVSGKNREYPKEKFINLQHTARTGTLEM
jgi:hypothetical protein